MNISVKIACCLLLCVSSLYAVEIKPSAGYGILLNDAGSLGSDESQTKGGINGSVRALFIVSGNLSVGAEAGYMPLYKWNYNLASGADMSLTYDTIPLLAAAEYKFGGNDVFSPYGILDCGAFITGFKTASSIAGIKTETDSSRTYIGGAIGAGAVVKFKSFNLDLSVRYVIINDDTSEKTKLLSINLGTRFNIFKK